MIKFLKPLTITLALLIVFMGAGVVFGSMHSKAAGSDVQTQAGQTATAQATTDQKAASTDQAGNNTTGMKALAAGLAIGLASLGGALAMGNAIHGSADGVARQPEAGDKIQTVLMLGLVFIETVVIYALIVAILIVFVM